MPEKSLIDSGPLVALFDKDDSHHQQAVTVLQTYRGELFSTLAVVTEVCYLLDFSVNAQTDFLSWVHMGAVHLVNVGAQDLARIIELMIKYSDSPMDFADASLVAVAERLTISNIFTVDSDFDVYRLYRTKTFHNLFFG